MGKGRPGASAAKAVQTSATVPLPAERVADRGGAPSPLLDLHRAIGNAAVGRLVREANLPTAVSEELARSGEPLDPSTRALMERRFGADFGAVRIHADGPAGATARTLGAKAYTVGDHVVFAPGRYAPHTREGRVLLVHELAHTIQQRRAVDAAPSRVGDGALETAAERTADAFDARDGRLEVVGASAPGLALAEDKGARGAAEDVAAYQRLRQLQEEADARSRDLFEKNIAQQKEKHKADPDKVYGGFTVGVGYALDEQGQLQTIISTNQGTRRGPVREGPGEVFAGPAVKRPPRERKKKDDAGDAPASPTVAAHPTKPAAKPRKTDETMTPDDARVHAEANITAEARKRQWRLVAVGASRDVCRYCQQKITESGGTISSDQRKRREIPDESIKPHITDTVEALKQAGQLAGPAPTPVVTRRWPGRGPGGPTGTPPGGGPPPGTPPPGGGPAPGTPTPGVLPPAGGTAAGAPPIAKPATTSTPAGATTKKGARATATAPAATAEFHTPGTAPAAKATTAGTSSTNTATLEAPTAVHTSAATKSATDAAMPTHVVDSGTAKAKPSPLVTSPKPKIAAPTNSSPAGGSDLKAPMPPSAKPAPATLSKGTSKPAAGGATQAQETSTGRTSAGGSNVVAKPSAVGSNLAPKLPVGGTIKPVGGNAIQAAPGIVSAIGPSPATKPAEPIASTPPTAAPNTNATAVSTPNLAAAKAQVQTKPAAPPSLESGPPDVSGKPASTTKTSFDLAGVKRTTESTEQTGPVTKTSKTTTTATFGGLSRSEETLRRDEQGRGKSDRTAFGLSRGEGRLGVSRTRSTATGRFDEEGKLLKGEERSTNVTGGVIAGDQGVGAFGGATTETTTAHGGGVTTKQSFGVNGEFLVDVKEVPGKTPVQYQITLTISLGAHAGVGAGVGEGKTASLSGGASGSVTGTFVHTFSAEETEKYLGALRNQGAGGAQKELRVIRLAAGGSLDDAKQLLTSLQASALSADAARTMTPGDSATLGEQGKVEGGLGLGAGGKGGGPSIGAEVSFSKSGSLKRTVSRRPDGKVVVRVEVLSESGVKAGGSGSYGVVSGGLTYGKTNSQGRAVSFELDPNDPDYTKHFNAISAADSIDQLSTLAAQDPKLVGATAESKGWSTTTTPKAGVAGAEIALSTTHSYGERVIHGKEGTTKEFSGASGGGVDVGIQGGPKLSYSQSQSVSTQVGPDKRARGDLSVTTSETDVGGSLLKLAQKVEDKPIATTAGLATGGTKVLQSHTEVTGMKVSDDDYATIVATAKNSSAWSKAFRGYVNQSYADWMALGPRIARAQDREEVARLLAEYSSKNDKAAEAVQAAVRPVGSIAGGIRYDWPEELAGDQATFDSLVVDDAIAPAMDQAGQGKLEEALGTLNTDSGKLAKLSQKIEQNQEKFSDAAAVAEMLRRIGDRLTEYRAEIRKLKAALKPAGDPPKADPGKGDAAKGDPPPAKDSATDEAKAEADARRDERGEKIGQLIPAMLTLRDRERAVFAEVDKELNDPPWYRNTDVVAVFDKLNALQRLYEEWDPSVTQLKAVYKERGEEESRADQFAPDRAGWKARRYHKSLTKWG